ncbi:hypothetical protein [Endozoicomonas ascidiicola]|uniref:hypothetical protein n=1 Tax=Endozoicomonas ascidiicola TaxID=1698521 RepID=UPI000833D3F1|nr:hypothetical protein [Endozoicomonas ascidiicola]
MNKPKSFKMQIVLHEVMSMLASLAFVVPMALILVVLVHDSSLTHITKVVVYCLAAATPVAVILSVISQISSTLETQRRYMKDQEDPPECDNCENMRYFTEGGDRFPCPVCNSDGLHDYYGHD